MEIQKIIKRAIEDTVAEYMIYDKSRQIINDFIKTILAYNTSTIFTTVAMDSLQREINATEDPSVVYSFLLDIRYKISLDLLELNLTNEANINSGILFNILLSGHKDSLDNSYLINDESSKLYELKDVGGMDIIIYLLVQNKFKLVELLKQI